MYDTPSTLMMDTPFSNIVFRIQFQVREAVKDLFCTSKPPKNRCINDILRAGHIKLHLW